MQANMTADAHGDQIQEQQPQQQPQKKLRSACNVCHLTKVRCSGGNPCDNCFKFSSQCTYSVSSRQGRPKGVKNKKTVGRLKAAGHISVGDRASPSAPHPQSGVSSRLPSTAMAPLTPPTEMETGASHGLPTSPCESEHYRSFYNNDPVGSTQRTRDNIDPNVLQLPSQQNQPQKSPTLFPFEFLNLGGGSNSGSHTDTFSAPGFATDNSIPNCSMDIEPFMFTTVGQHNNHHHHHQANAMTDITPTTPEAALEGTCDCFQRCTELLCHLKTLDRPETDPQIDIILLCTRQAGEAWRHLLQCANCKRSNDEESLLMFIMSIRVALRNLESLFWTDKSQSGGGDADYSSGASVGSATPPAGDHDLRRRPSCKGLIKSTVGIYEMNGEERAVVTKFLVSRMADEIKEILHALKERMATTVPRSSCRETVELARPLLHSVESALHALGQRLHSMDVLNWDVAT